MPTQLTVFNKLCSMKLGRHVCALTMILGSGEPNESDALRKLAGLLGLYTARFGTLCAIMSL